METERTHMDEVARLCAEAGFPLAAVREEGDVLVLVPSQLRKLPAADTLRGLAERIREHGYRHVAFSVEAEEGG